MPLFLLLRLLYLNANKINFWPIPPPTHLQLQLQQQLLEPAFDFINIFDTFK